ncbi:Protein of unknown function, putative, partial [Plasmodium vivax]
CMNNNIFNKTNMSDGILGIRIDRLLAKRELSQKEERNNLLHKPSDYINNRGLQKGAENISKYNTLGKNKLNNWELYRKNYEKRYNKKKGISKLECYCENKIFDKFDHIYDLEEKIKNGKKHLKKKLYKKYGLPIVLLNLFPLLALIIPTLDKYYNMHPWLSCGITDNDPNKHESSKTIITYICGTNIAFFITFSIILLLIFIYILLKALKYKRLKEGSIIIKN